MVGGGGGGGGAKRVARHVAVRKQDWTAGLGWEMGRWAEVQDWLSAGACEVVGQVGFETVKALVSKRGKERDSETGGRTLTKLRWSTRPGPRRLATSPEIPQNHRCSSDKPVVPHTCILTWLCIQYTCTIPGVKTIQD